MYVCVRCEDSRSCFLHELIKYDTSHQVGAVDSNCIGVPVCCVYVHVFLWYSCRSVVRCFAFLFVFLRYFLIFCEFLCCVFRTLEVLYMMGACVCVPYELLFVCVCVFVCDGWPSNIALPCALLVRLMA